VVIGAVAALLAAVLPARRAAQVSVVSAMADVG
jgi:ABC-type lipoprotein release transport system permease subunit